VFIFINDCNYFSASSPVFVTQFVNLTALDGKDATIPCKAEGAPAPNVTWFFNGKPLKNLGP
jgi:protein sidekick